MRKLLFVEDDLNLSSIVIDNLEELGFEVNHVVTGEDALSSLQSEPVDIILMDVELPGLLNGFDTAEAIRSLNSFVPILFATARQSGEDFERGFKIMNMDYVKKPYKIKEITLRIKGLIGKEVEKDAMISIGSLSFDPIMRKLFGNGTEHHLTNLESELLQLLGENMDKVVYRDKIIQELWGLNDDPKGKESSVHNQIYMIRKYFKDEPTIAVEVVSKKGYRITTLPSSEV